MAIKEDEIPTPALVIDLGKVEANLRRMRQYVDTHGLKLRPHTKTHKSLRMAKLQLNHGAVGLTTAKVGEAQVMALVGQDLTVGYPVHDRPRVTALAELAKLRTIRVALDSGYAADRIAEATQSAGSTVGVLVDLDTGMQRTGLQHPEQTVDLAKQVEATAGLRLDGLFCYQGHILGTEDEMVAQCRDVAKLLKHTLGLWKENGLAAGIVSGGSTPAARVMHHIPQLTEIRPGTFIYNDRNYTSAGACSIEHCAAHIVATVMSNAVPGKIILDCGSKTLTSDRYLGNADDDYGLVVEYPQAKIDHLTEEHGRVDIAACDHSPKLGERIHVIPNHICACVNLQNHVWFKDSSGEVEKAAVDTRGMLS